MHNMLKNIFTPNKPFEELFRQIEADRIIKKYSDGVVLVQLTVSQFYQLREELILAMLNKNPELLKKRMDMLRDYESQFGMFWIIGMYEDTYDITLKMSENF